MRMPSEAREISQGLLGGIPRLQGSMKAWPKAAVSEAETWRFVGNFFVRLICHLRRNAAGV